VRSAKGPAYRAARGQPALWLPHPAPLPRRRARWPVSRAGALQRQSRATRISQRRIRRSAAMDLQARRL